MQPEDFASTEINNSISISWFVDTIGIVADIGDSNKIQQSGEVLLCTKRFDAYIIGQGIEINKNFRCSDM